MGCMADPPSAPLAPRRQPAGAPAAPVLETAPLLAAPAMTAYPREERDHRGRRQTDEEEK